MTRLSERLHFGPRNAIYTSPDIQNSLLNILANLVRTAICNGVREADMFSVLADETKDCSKQEQLAIAVRYIDKAMIREHFIQFESS